MNSALIPSLGYTVIIVAITTLVVVVGTLLFSLRAEKDRPRDRHDSH